MFFGWLFVGVENKLVKGLSIGINLFSCDFTVLYTGLSLRAGGRGFSPATKRVASGYFYWKIEEK